tara:strand:+ start:2344 stop:3006 length:663 start_codon:yes stop_codon:yes gene_type:complete
MINHHLSSEILISYAAGNTSPSESLIVASHLSYCGKCRKELEFYEKLGGELLEDAGPVDINTSSIDNVLSKIDIDESREKVVEPPIMNSIFKDIPSVLSNYLPDGNNLTDKWSNGLGGIKYFDIDLGNSKQNTRARMLSIPPGKKLPHHGHEGQELTLVIQGGFSDENGSYDSGDVAIEDENNIHTPISDPKEGCVCLVVYEGNLKFKGIFGPILNFLKI